MKRVVFAALCLALVTGAARADLTLTVRAPGRSIIFLNGAYKGHAPQVFPSMAAGSYELIVEDLGTGNYQVYGVSSPDHQTVDQTLTVHYNGNARIVERIVVHSNKEIQPYKTGNRSVPHPPTRGGVVVYPYPVAVEIQPGRSHANRDRVRTRNAILGVGVLNEALNTGKRRDRVRRGVLGGAVLNQIIRR